MSDKVPAYKDAPLPPIDPPLPSNPMTTGDALPSQPPEYSYPQDQPDTGYDVQYPSTYHPQYTSDQQKQNTNVIVQQQVTSYVCGSYVFVFVYVFVCVCLCACVCVSCVCIFMYVFVCVYQGI